MEELFINSIDKKNILADPKIFLEKIKKRDDVALIFLKGGRNGGLKPEIKSKIIGQLENFFDITLGEEKELSFDEIVSRWGKGYLKYPAMEIAKKNPKFSEDFFKTGEELLNKKNRAGFNEWLKKAKEIANDDIGLLRLEMLLSYYSSGGQNILLKLKEGLNRMLILEELGITPKQKDLSLSFQELIKKYIVGDTTANKSTKGTLRFLLAEGTAEKAFSYLWENPNDEWGSYNNLKDSSSVALNLFNGIHAPGSVDELETDINLLSKNDLEKFNSKI